MADLPGLLERAVITMAPQPGINLFVAIGDYMIRLLNVIQFGNDFVFNTGTSV